ncbi:MAG TPA: hypothetical protein VMW78_08175 [Anaerolineae bacterium]|nr:hypothetical protein [Anaerolineae bacterium]
MKRIRILNLLKPDKPIDNVIIMGWIRTRRDSKGFSFLEINDGSCLKNIRVERPTFRSIFLALQQI